MCRLGHRPRSRRRRARWRTGHRGNTRTGRRLRQESHWRVPARDSAFDFIAFYTPARRTMTDDRQRSAIELARVLWDYHRVVASPVPADAIIGLGSYDLRVARWCAQLLQGELAPVLVFTGSYGN